MSINTTEQVIKNIGERFLKRDLAIIEKSDLSDFQWLIIYHSGTAQSTILPLRAGMKESALEASYYDTFLHKDGDQIKLINYHKAKQLINLPIELKPATTIEAVWKVINDFVRISPLDIEEVNEYNYKKILVKLFRRNQIPTSRFIIDMVDSVQ